MRNLYILIAILVFSCFSIFAPHPSTAATAPANSVLPRDGRHDFDWDLGVWKIHQRRLLHPLTGSTTWVQYDGTDIVRKIWDGANTGVIESDGSAGHIELFTVRMYDPDAHTWNIYFATSRGGALSTPVIGTFSNGVGEFTDHEDYGGKPIMVRFRVSDITPTSCHFEQAFSADGGKTWETNFIVEETLQSHAG